MIVALGQLASIVLSSVDKHVRASEAEVRLCNYLDVYRNRRLTKDHLFANGTATPSEIRRFALEQGDVVITKDSETPDDIGIPALVVDDLPNVICGYHLAIVRPREELHPPYLLQFLQSDAAKRHFLKMANGLTRFGIGLRAITSVPLLLPPLDEQKNVARVLDAADAATAAAAEEVDAARAAGAALLGELLTRGIDGAGHIRSRNGDVQSIGMANIPKEWKLSTVGREFALQTGITLNESKRGSDKTRPYLRVANVRRDHVDLDDVQLLAATEQELAERRLQPNDLLVVEGHANRREIGRCALVPDAAAGMTFQNHLFRLRTRGDVDPVYGCLWLNSEYAQRYWNGRCGTSSGLNTINQRALRTLVMPVPSKAEQRVIVSLVLGQRAYLDHLVEIHAAAEEVKAALLTELLSKHRSTLQVVAAAAP